MIYSFLFDRRSVIEKLARVPKSPARTRLINILRMSNQDIIIALYDSWCERQYGVRPLESETRLPDRLIPDTECPEEFFQFLSDALKKSI